ncbi:hypothetical protein GUJ93_ZPchr0013g35178 [Zizania palustris]|uniref:Uncharacterized protein n=1 Tax=Zizania palustris TaxID=103762 RepID=A0A8J6BWW9_ZIZPA|nr:hypothetical protein GUJ93_ZPchr0013g35542 [Zizania palustris]KAG8097853.1 hypothetical protein GUJ93_ZPchr0013g35178 [Zizania palustris]
MKSSSPNSRNLKRRRNGGNASSAHEIIFTELRERCEVEEWKSRGWSADGKSDAPAAARLATFIEQGERARAVAASFQGRGRVAAAGACQGEAREVKATTTTTTTTMRAELGENKAARNRVVGSLAGEGAMCRLVTCTTASGAVTRGRDGGVVDGERCG